jgi:hypothetical protein
MKYQVRIFRDISDTLHLFNFTLPSLVRGIWTVALQGKELYKQRNDIDGLAIGRPALVMLVQEGLDYALDQVVDLRRTEALERMNMDMSQLVSTVCDGLVEIQINNMQQHQVQLSPRNHCSRHEPKWLHLLIYAVENDGRNESERNGYLTRTYHIL